MRTGNNFTEPRIEEQSDSLDGRKHVHQAVSFPQTHLLFRGPGDGKNQAAGLQYWILQQQEA